ncbi:arylsulfatase B [Aplysia californica]|uniref:Arylsulfatase B n=1 Tax=Aplysia californica TaxID=6500 RepID=A0ABM1A766_APLCA|nr:arylsulfatase B [Aplysia californica]
MDIFWECLLACVTVVVLTDQVLAVRKPPHIVFIVADDLGWNDVGWHNPEILSPNLNRLARKGVTLESAYAQPACTPSRNAFMTGKYPYHTPLQDVIDPSEPAFLSDELPILPERLKALGYSTHIVGKWHLGFCNKKYTPTHRGFDSFFGFYMGSQCHYQHTKPDRILRELSSSVSLFSSIGGTLLRNFVRLHSVGHETGRDFRFNDSIWRETEGKYSTHAFADRAIEIIQRHDPDTPLFLYLPFQAPHSPITVPPQYSRLYNHIKSPIRRVYSGMVTALDEAVGNITSALYEKGLMDNLLLVFTSDNGGHPYMGGNNIPLRGGKNTIWEGGTRVPTFVYSDTLLRKRRYTNNEILHAVDWFPTFLEIAGGRREFNIDGVSQWQMISRGRFSSRHEFVYNIEPSGKGAVRIGNYKLIVGKPGRHNDWYPVPGMKPIKRKRFKGGRFDNVTLASDPYLLFNIKDDPSESRDLSRDKPEVLEALLARYRVLNATKVEPHRPGRVAGADPNLYDGFWSPGWC